MTFAEGRYREVSGCAALGHPVERLKRVQLGPLRLGTWPRAHRADPGGRVALDSLRGG